MNEHNHRQGASHRRGLVLGLTLAEIMLMLVFCFLIATATVLRRGQTELAQTKILFEQQQANYEATLASVTALRPEAALAEKHSGSAGSDLAKIEENRRELVEAKAVIGEIAKEGMSPDDLREKTANLGALVRSGIDTEKALRDADIVAAIKRALPDAQRTALSPQLASDLVVSAINATGDGGGHRWPPIISLSEEKGYSFRTGSAELVPSFRDALMTTTLDKILSIIKQYDVDVIEVVGHTDEQIYGPRLASPAVGTSAARWGRVPPAQGVRSSNLDRGLTAALKNGGGIAKLMPADNAGLGLARAVSVASVLRQSPKLTGYKLIPLSGGQLIDTDESLALNGAGGDVARRRRIEIRLRKSATHEAVAAISWPSPVGLLPRGPLKQGASSQSATTPAAPLP